MLTVFMILAISFVCYPRLDGPWLSDKISSEYISFTRPVLSYAGAFQQYAANIHGKKFILAQQKMENDPNKDSNTKSIAELLLESFLLQF